MNFVLLLRKEPRVSCDGQIEVEPLTVSL